MRRDVYGIVVHGFQNSFISLFYIGQWNLDLFTWTHLYLWPVLIMLDVLVVFLIYLRHLARQEVAPAHA